MFVVVLTGLPVHRCSEDSIIENLFYVKLFGRECKKFMVLGFRRQLKKVTKARRDESGSYRVAKRRGGGQSDHLPLPMRSPALLSLGRREPARDKARNARNAGGRAGQARVGASPVQTRKRRVSYAVEESLARPVVARKSLPRVRGRAEPGMAGQAQSQRGGITLSLIHI